MIDIVISAANIEKPVERMSKRVLLAKDFISNTEFGTDA